MNTKDKVLNYCFTLACRQEHVSLITVDSTKDFLLIGVFVYHMIRQEAMRKCI